MNSIGIIYNIAGISNKNNDSHYIQCINNILKQTYTNYKLVISSCLNNEQTIDNILTNFGEKASINWIKDLIPVNCSFNHSVLKLIEKYGDIFDCFLYIDSGIDFQDKNNILTELYSLYKSGPYGMVAARTDTNSGMYDWFNVGSPNDTDPLALDWFFNNLSNNFIIPVGKTINLHCQIYSNELVKFYNKPIIDCMAGEAHESLSTFQNAALNLKFIIHKDILVHHETSLDGPSSGFQPRKFVIETGQKPCFHGFKCSNILERIRGGYQFGLGFEEISSVQMHDQSKFDSDGNAICAELKDYIRDNLFLKQNELDYTKINSVWI